MAQIADTSKSKYITYNDFKNSLIKTASMDAGTIESPAGRLAALNAVEQVLKSKAGQTLIPPEAAFPFYELIFWLNSENKGTDAVKDQIKECERIIKMEIGQKADLEPDAIAKKLADAKQMVTDQVKKAGSTQKGARYGEYGDYADYDQDYYYSSYDRVGDENYYDLFDFNYNGARAGRLARYGDGGHYYNDGGRNRLYRSSRRGRNVYHRRGLQEMTGIEINGLRDYMDSSPIILLFVFLMAAICIFGAVFYNRYHKRNKSTKNDEDKMVVIQQKNNEESHA